MPRNDFESAQAEYAVYAGFEKFVGEIRKKNPGLDPLVLAQLEKIVNAGKALNALIERSKNREGGNMSSLRS